MTSSPHGLYVRGYTRATMVGTKRRQLARGSQSQKADLSTDCSLQLDCMKSESLVIPDQQAGVNTFPGRHRRPPLARAPFGAQLATHFQSGERESRPRRLFSEAPAVIHGPDEVGAENIEQYVQVVVARRSAEHSNEAGARRGIEEISPEVGDAAAVRRAARSSSRYRPPSRTIWRMKRASYREKDRLDLVFLRQWFEQRHEELPTE